MSTRLSHCAWQISNQHISILPIRKKPYMRVSLQHKSANPSRRPKRKVYQRVYDLDNAMDLQKKPSMILWLKSIIQAQKGRSLPLRDLEKEVGVVQKWNLMAIIERYPSIFHVGGGTKSPPFVTLSKKAAIIANEEEEALKQTEPIVVTNLRKLLMLTPDCKMPLEKIEIVEKELGLPVDYKQILIPKYPKYFTVRNCGGKDALTLENWDSSLAVTSREEKLALEGTYITNPSKKVRICSDGNFKGPFAFKMCFARGFRPNRKFLEGLERWQRMEFPSPYLNARRFDIADPKARKRVLGVLHELLSLTMEKRMTISQIDALHCECMLPARLLLCLIKNHGIFYVTNKGARGTVFLKEGYCGSQLIEKPPLLLFREKFLSISGWQQTHNC